MAPDNPAPVPQHNLSHLRIDRFHTGFRYTSPASNRTERPFTRDRGEHASRLKAELSAAFSAARARVATRQLATRRKRPGIYVEVQSEPGQQIPELTWMRKGIRLGAVRTDQNHVQVAGLFVPEAASSFFGEKLDAYGGGLTGVGKVPYRERFEHLENIQVGTLKTLWVDTRPLPEDANSTLWWECWCWRDLAEELRTVATELGFNVSDRVLRFPDLEILLIHGNLTSLEEIIHQTSAIERLRYALDSPAFFTDVTHREQRAWVEDLRERIIPAGPFSPAVCLLDTGVTRSHPLLDQCISAQDCLSVDTAWGTDDTHPAGHGTNMAGVVLFSDLTFPLSDQGPMEVPFILESVKIIPPPQLLPNDPRSYGSITQSAVAVAELNAPNRDRAFCMAVSNLDVSGEQPTSWSAALDQICSGATIGDGTDGVSRLVVVSAGNIGDHNGPDDLDDLSEFPIEDPAQAWNALCVGGFTNKSEISSHDTYNTWSAFAEAGALSPYSRVSLDWVHGRTPIKPEIVFEAGNRALSPEGIELLSGVSSLSLLTTAKDFTDQPLTTFWATSAATAQAAGMAGRLLAHDPSWWPETVRALMVHSSSWTPWMKQQIDQCAGKNERLVFARQFGYGVPDLNRALSSAQNDLFMISQAVLQPFFKEISEKDGRTVVSAPKLYEMHMYDLPWPVQSLQRLAAQDVELKITLSYFVEPNLGDKTSVLPPKYRSCGLRFHLKRPGETDPHFLSRLNDIARQEEENTLPAEDDPDWHFGPRSIAAGSLHCDIWRGAAATLALRDKIAVVPVGGWWKEKVRERRFESSLRYSLIVSITSTDRQVELHAEVAQVIESRTIAVDINTPEN